MKRIIKQEVPEWFETWKRNFETVNGRTAHYKDDFATEDEDGIIRRRHLRKELVEEQGYICCYCMKRISIDSSHIEHFWPKGHFGTIDLEYTNMLASCNGEGKLIMDEYCGHKKEDWWIKDMIPPTDAGVEDMFRYSVSGKIHSVQGRPDANIAQEMIRHLGLDSFHLERNRRDAIQSSEICDEEEYTDDEIRDLIHYYSNKDNGNYVPYCQAIVDCLKRYL